MTALAVRRGCIYYESRASQDDCRDRAIRRCTSLAADSAINNKSGYRADCQNTKRKG